MIRKGFLVLGFTNYKSNKNRDLWQLITSRFLRWNFQYLQSKVLFHFLGIRFSSPNRFYLHVLPLCGQAASSTLWKHMHTLSRVKSDKDTDPTI